MKSKFYAHFFSVTLFLFGAVWSYAQCPATCTYTEANGPNINMNGNETLCITANTGNLFINFNGSNNTICIAPGVTWTQTNGLNLNGVTINVYGTWEFNANINANSASVINIYADGTMTTNTSGFGSNLTINNSGTLNFTNSGAISNQGNFILNNNATGEINALTTTNFLIGNGNTFNNYGTATLANAENSEATLHLYNGSTWTVYRNFNNHGAFIVDLGADFEIPCIPLAGAAGTTLCSFRVGDKGVGQQFINNSCCFEVSGGVTFDGPSTNNGTIIIHDGDLTINKASTGTNGHIVVANGLSTINNAGSYSGTNLTFCDQNTVGNNFDNIFNNPGTNLYSVDCSVTMSCCTGCTLTASASSNSPVCAGSTINLTATPSDGTPPYSYNWTGPDGFTSTTQSPSINNATVAASGSYALTVTDFNGCTVTQSITVTVNALPAVTCPGNLSVCSDTEAFALSGGAPSGGVYSGPGVSAGNFDPLAAGVGTHTITYSYTDGNGCSNSCSFTITVAEAPVFTLAQTPPTCSGATSLNDGTISLETNAGGVSYGVSSINAGTYDGPDFASAPTIASLGALPAVIESNIPNTGGSFIVRVFASASCFTDQVVQVEPVVCLCPTNNCWPTTATKNN